MQSLSQNTEMIVLISHRMLYRVQAAPHVGRYMSKVLARVQHRVCHSLNHLYSNSCLTNIVFFRLVVGVVAL